MVIVQIQVDEGVCTQPNACQVMAFLATSPGFTEPELDAARVVLKHVAELIAERERQGMEQARKIAEGSSTLQ